MAAWKKIGTIMKGDKGSYLKIDLDKTKGETHITLKQGQRLQIFDPRKSKFMTEERLAKLPDYVKAEVFVTPDEPEKQN
jgi:hypothetical protein